MFGGSKRKKSLEKQDEGKDKAESVDFNICKNGHEMVLQYGVAEGKTEHWCARCTKKKITDLKNKMEVRFKRCMVCDYDLCSECCDKSKTDYDIYKMINNRA